MIRLIVAIIILDSVVPTVAGFTFHYRQLLSPAMLSKWSFWERVQRFLRFTAIFYAAFLLPGVILSYKGVRLAGISGGVMGGLVATIPATLVALTVLDLLKHGVKQSGTAVYQPSPQRVSSQAPIQPFYQVSE